MKKDSAKISMDAFIARYNALNKAQKEAVDTIEGPVLVVAGPGSGKTEILGLRVAKILREAQVLPSQILCLTFTDSASINMRNRLAGLIGDEAYKVSIHTFHNFCVNIISRYPEYFYKGTSFSPADPVTKTEIIEGIIEGLEFNNPLRTEHPEKGYVHLRSIVSGIEALKKSGLLPDDFKTVLKENSIEIEELNAGLQKVFSDKISKETAGKAEDFLNKLSKKIQGGVIGAGINSKDIQEKFIVNSFPSLSSVIYHALKKACDESAESGKTVPLTTWKKEYMRVDGKGDVVLSETLYQEKMQSLVDIYEKYRNEMYNRALFDFDDMILDVIEAFKKHRGLLTELQEQFQYILVDEFQDTNEAQMTIVKMIASAPVNEGRPNVMVVGDDDQAVYRFQGAELSNILNFSRIFNDVKMVTMTDNYRSTQEILDVASHIIKKGKERLEYVIPEMEKNLIARNEKLHADEDGKIIDKSRIHHIQLPSKSHECHYISREVKRLIDAGVAPSDIAIISRKHEPLETLVSFMKGAGVPVKYEREQNVLTEPHIQELVILARYVASLIKKEEEPADDLLPKIFSFPFWRVPRIDVWKLSMEARLKDGNNRRFIEVALESKNQQIRQIAEFLIELSGNAQHEPLELILDRMVGAHVPLIPDNSEEESDEVDLSSHKKSLKSEKPGQSQKVDGEFFSPFKTYYFNKEKFSHARSEYLTFLSSLRVFISALKDFRKGEELNIQDLVDFVDIHEKNKIPLNDRSPFANSLNAVELLTAHKSKGLEFDIVFIMSCQDEVWAGRGIPNSLPMPSNLPIYPAGDNEDDKLRLFYVALTRAKRQLYLTSYSADDGGKESALLRFIVDDKEKVSEKIRLALEAESTAYLGPDAPNAHEVLTASWVKYYMPPFLNEETALLKTLLKDYKLSITHLNNFLNLEKGGPELFFEQNLLRFPQAKTPAGAFGTAIHKALEEMITKFKQNGKLPDMAFIEDVFVKALRRERIGKENFRIFKDKGIKYLTDFIKEKASEFSLKDSTEINFADQVVVIDGAILTGKIDRMAKLDSIGGGVISVHDYKTGKPLESWTGGSVFDKAKLYQFKRQLAFYKILIENSRNYSNLKMKHGVIDFIQPQNDRVISLTLDMDTEEERLFTDRVKRLAKIVYDKILNLDFPDTSKFSADYKGMIEFEDYLLSKI